MPALNVKLVITRVPDNNSPLMPAYSFFAYPADPTLQFPSNLINYPYNIGSPADPVNGIYTTLADAQTDFITNILPGLIPAVNSTYPTSTAYTSIGTISWFDQTLQDALVTNITRTTSTLSLSLVGTGATGTQISSTKDSQVKVTVSTSATASITGAGTSTVALKICATNNATEGSWTTVATSETSQSYALAIAISGVTGMKEELVADVPAGWFVKLVNSGSGTHSESFVSGQKTIYG